MTKTWHRRGWLAAQTLAAVVGVACAPADPPPTREVVHLYGDGYARGLQHGQQLGSKVRSFYTTLLTASILPNLNREQPELAAVFQEYAKDRYANGQFSYELLLDNARSMEKSIPKSLRDELHGIADGAGVPYEEVLILNTFVDGLLSIRSVANLAKASGAPVLERVELLPGEAGPGLDADGVDNDGDGTADDADEAAFDYAASAFATRVELPADARLRFVLMDEDGVDPATVRVTIDQQLYVDGDPALTLRTLPDDPTRLEVTVTPPAPLPEGAFAVLVQAGDQSLVTAPPPAHARFMRDEVLTFTRAGTGKQPWEIDNVGLGVPNGKAPAWAFAARGDFTKDGAPLLAQQFALLDGNTAHKHTVVFVHHPESGPPFAVVGWAGVVWGMSGMNARGLAGACNPSDSLNNSVVRGLVEQLGDFDNAKLLASGQPVGVFLRRALESDETVDEVVTRAKDTRHTFGWSCLFADADDGLRALELDADFNHEGGVTDFGPGDAPTENGRPYASLTKDDLRIGAHFAKHQADMPELTLAGQRLHPQAGYSTFFFRSLTATARVGDELAKRQGALDATAAKEILKVPELIDHTDSMNAVVFEPRAHRLWTAMGAEPATEAEFQAEVLNE